MFEHKLICSEEELVEPDCPPLDVVLSVELFDDPELPPEEATPKFEFVFNSIVFTKSV